MKGSKLFVVDFRGGKAEAKMLDVTGVVSSRRCGSGPGDIITMVSASDDNQYDILFSADKDQEYCRSYDYFAETHGQPVDSHPDMSIDAYFKCFLSGVAGALGKDVSDVAWSQSKGIAIMKERYFALCNLMQERVSSERFIVMNLMFEDDDVTVRRGYVTAVEPDTKTADGSCVVFRMFEFVTPKDGEVFDVPDPDGGRFFVMRATNNVTEDFAIAKKLLSIINEKFSLKVSENKLRWELPGAVEFKR